MKVVQWLSPVLILFAAIPGHAGDGAEFVDPFEIPVSNPAQPGTVEWRAPDAVLYDNGPLVTLPGGGAGGYDISELQTTLGMSTVGYGHQLDFGNSVADDFTVSDANGWVIDDITFFAYQTGSTTSSPITGVYVRIWNGPPDAGGSVIWGDLSTNRLQTTGWTNIYRVTDTAQGDTNRPIMWSEAAIGTAFAQGTYWVEWSTDGATGYSGPWAPPISIPGATTTGNALQYTSGDWRDVMDSGTGTPQGMPFIISGSVPSSTGQAVTAFSGGIQYPIYHSGSTGDVVGWRFTVSVPTTVSAVGIWNADTSAGGAGLTAPHRVGIWDSSEALLAQTSVDPTGTVFGVWRYRDIPAIALVPGEVYTIGALYLPDDNDLYISGASSMSTDPDVVWNGSVYPSAASLGFTYPENQSTSFGRFGPNFRIGAPGADLSINTTDSSCFALPGNPITYTITVANRSGIDAMGALVEDDFPPEIIGVSWTCISVGGGSCSPSGSGDISDPANLPAGSALVYVATGTVSPAASGTLVNSAAVLPPFGQSDINMANNQSIDRDALELPVFCDAFESGSTATWSNVTP